MTGYAERNTSPYEFFLQLARRNVPRHHFDGGDVTAWQAAAKPAVLATLGELPPAVDPRPELIAEWEEGGLIRQRWLIDVQDGLSAVAYVHRPAGLEPGERRPGILCWAGHGGFGKEPVMGNSSSAELRTAIDKQGSNYGERMAQAGFITFAIDWMGEGDLDDRRKPHHRDIASRRDLCDVFYLHATMLGMTSLGLNVSHGRALVDFASTLPFVDADHLGVMGESYGGTLALWTALVDDRLRAVEIISYSDVFPDFGYRDTNYCGSQVAPGLFTLVDVPDLQGLLLPRPLLVDVGVYDDGFRVESALACHRQLQEIYAAAGAEKQLALELAPSGHGWHQGRKSLEFFTTHLGAV
jgi:dienelactone hydrolase